jgi:hypothetical protein
MKLAAQGRPKEISKCSNFAVFIMNSNPNSKDVAKMPLLENSSI